MTRRPARIALQQTAIGDYRQAVLELLVERWGENFEIFAGTEYFDASTRTRVHLPHNLNMVRNRFLLGRRLEWQHGVISPLTRADAAIVEFNPRILSVWVILVLRRLRGRRSVLWGHAWSRSGREARTDSLRQAMRRLAGVVLVYTDADRDDLMEKMPRTPIFVAPNSLSRKSEMCVLNADSEPWDFLYSGRLVPAKKPVLAVRAFIAAVDAGLDSRARLVIAGDGPERQVIADLVTDAGLADRIRLLGHVNPVAMGDHYATAMAAVSPGYVGLSIIQSLGHGIPMIYARDEPHAPEVVAAEVGFNAIAVDSDSVPAMRDAMRKIVAERDAWLARRQAIVERCAASYSVEVMADGIQDAVTYDARD